MNNVFDYTKKNLDTFLKSGDFVVHFEHGIGRYIGTKIIKTGKIENEYLMIKYLKNDILYVPLTSMHLVNKYAPCSIRTENITLNKLGSDVWKKTRKKTIHKIKDLAVELLDNISERLSKKGFEFKNNIFKYKSFCDNCNFELTYDQKKAIDAVLYDMQRNTIMNRLICGDVGFGKTEIAMRAAFVAVENKKQVALLAPTTLLTQQHFKNFSLRFKNWPIKIAMLSRFLNVQEQKKVLNEILEGTINIVIGTHRILQKDIIWYDLGLLIIDEEHRFGVSQKECINTLRSGIDILALTATPIPRTLNMAINGLRDLSIISTPPKHRFAIKTFIYEYDQIIIKQAIENELLRKGQVYYLHNNIKTITKTLDFLKKLVPKARIEILHSKMCKKSLKRIMKNFQNNNFDVLVCTTIIETGIDIANANTIIIEYADQFGLAQLNQLRGRVGRSFRQAYAYFLTSPKCTLKENSKKRLEAISAIHTLGSGFSLSINDLEIRGSGELLGSKQSGQINSIGISLYHELLNHAIHAIKSGKEISLENIKNSLTEVDLHIPAFFPESYIADVSTRLNFYKKIFSCTISEIYSLENQLIHNFGIIPEFVCNLIETAKIRQTAHTLGIKKINLHQKGGFIEFHKNNKVNHRNLIKILQNSKMYNFVTNTKLKIEIYTSNSDRIKYIKKFLTSIS
ncbi:MAG: transcription-repair coupling factor [Wigglesworthia glossinidia]|nr:transcription-repair coupling factor [Wigglesworthia glossinidia]